MKIELKNISGKAVGSFDLDDSVFGAEVHEHLLWEAVKWQLAKRRAGTASTKRFGEVRGSHEEDLEAEGHRPGAPRRQEGADLRRRWLGLRTQAARLRVHDAAQGQEGRAPRRALAARQSSRRSSSSTTSRRTARPSRSRPRSRRSAAAARR